VIFRMTPHVPTPTVRLKFSQPSRKGFRSRYDRMTVGALAILHRFQTIGPAVKVGPKFYGWGRKATTHFRHCGAEFYVHFATNHAPPGPTHLCGYHERSRCIRWKGTNRDASPFLIPPSSDPEKATVSVPFNRPTTPLPHHGSAPITPVYKNPHRYHPIIFSPLCGGYLN
jgi:hypothetical protein